MDMSRFTRSARIVAIHLALVINDKTAGFAFGVSLPRETGMFIAYGG